MSGPSSSKASSHGCPATCSHGRCFTPASASSSFCFSRQACLACRRRPRTGCWPSCCATTRSTSRLWGSSITGSTSGAARERPSNTIAAGHSHETRYSLSTTRHGTICSGHLSVAFRSGRHGNAWHGGSTQTARLRSLTSAPIRSGSFCSGSWCRFFMNFIFTVCTGSSIFRGSTNACTTCTTETSILDHGPGCRCIQSSICSISRGSRFISLCPRIRFTF